jgi:hypothetical protein
MKWVVPVVVGLVLVLFVGFALVGLAVQGSSLTEEPYVAYPYSTTYSGTGPEWDKLREAEKKGEEGYADIQALMLSSDTSVALQAAIRLTTKDDAAANLFFEQIPNIDPTVKEGLRSSWYEPDLVVQAARAVKDKDPKTKDGAMTFINLCYMRDTYGSSQPDEAFKILVSAIPNAKGTEADKLSYTIGLFRPQSQEPLIALLSHESARVRETAVAALGKMESQESLSQISALKSDPSADVRAAAANAESNINASVAMYSSSSYGSVDPGSLAVDSERAGARKRLCMP